jgi:hypothetical protein
LSNSQAAATLAAVLIGYNIIIGQTPEGENIRLLSEDILNGTIIMILITCTIASFATQKAAINIAKSDLKHENFSTNSETENILIGLSNEATIESLIQLTVNTLDKKKDNKLFGLNVITNEKENAERINKAKKLIELAEKYSSSIDVNLNPLIRYDLNIVSGMINTIKEKNIKHFFVGLHEKTSLVDTFFGKLTRDLIDKNDSTVYIYKSKQPISTIKKFVLVIPANAELEQGFHDWYQRIIQISKNTGNRFEIFANQATIDFLKNTKQTSNVYFFEFPEFEDFLVISRYVIDDTMLIINLSRKEGVSYQPAMDKIATICTSILITAVFCWFIQIITTKCQTRITHIQILRFKTI